MVKIIMSTDVTDFMFLMLPLFKFYATLRCLFCQVSIGTERNPRMCSANELIYSATNLIIEGVDLVGSQQGDGVRQQIGAAACQHAQGHVLLELDRAFLSVQMT